MTEERFSLKDHLFNQEKVAYLGGLLSTGVAGFDRHRFEEEVMAEMLDLELKERIGLIARVMGEQLDEDFETAAAQLEASLPPPLDPTLTDDDFGDFIIAPLGKFVEDEGLEHLETSLPLLRQLTMRFSMEGPIRPFIDRYPDQVFDRLMEWTADDNYHVRRLVSEGTRPRLPWAGRLSTEIERPLPLLDKLYSDPTRYVTRSVANHLNDIAKIKPSVVVQRLEAWATEGRQEPAELAWMTKHALRTLIKQGNAEALGLLGFSTDPDVTAALKITTPLVRASEALEFEVDLHAHADESLIVDYLIDFVKANGETKPKVFKLKTLDLAADTTTAMKKRHPLRANATTYTLYAGQHGLTVVANGKPVASGSFEMVL